MQPGEAVDNLYLFDPEFQPSARHFVNKVRGSSAACAIDCWNDLKKATDYYGLVKFLMVDTHGCPGVVALAKGPGITAVDVMMLQPKRRFLMPEARILFLGCNLGEGDAGDKFMAAVGKYWLTGKGGFVGAATVPVDVFQLGPFATDSFIEPFQSGKLKVKRYSSSGAEIASQTVEAPF
jgi:hypothetical protein